MRPGGATPHEGTPHDATPHDVTSCCRPEALTLVEYVAGMTVEEVQRELGLSDIVKLSSNENPLGPSPRVLEAIAATLPKLATYPEKSFFDLKGALAEANGVAAESVFVGHGTEALIQLIPQLYVSPGDEVVVADVTFGRYEEASKLMGARVVRVPLSDLRHDLEAMAAAVTPRTRVVWLCNPNNPTGTIVRRDEVAAFLAAVPPTVAVVFDQAYFEFADAPEYPDGLEYFKAGHDNVIVLRTFSKAYGLAGLRLGYGIAAPAVRQLLDTIKEPFNLNRLSVAAGPVALADTDWRERCVEENRRGRELLVAELARLGFDPVPSQTNFVFVDVKQNADALFERLLHRGVIVRPASGWGLPTCMRVTVGTPEQNRRFLEALAAETA
ncbi:MAG: histidinol-phosphate transaminase [Thermoleophilia bacterium]|nr:histidinol-phosphate transaminase [Thermoleophilia bacterium]